MYNDERISTVERYISSFMRIPATISHITLGFLIGLLVSLCLIPAVDLFVEDVQLTELSLEGEENEGEENEKDKAEKHWLGLTGLDFGTDSSTGCLNLGIGSGFYPLPFIELPTPVPDWA